MYIYKGFVLLRGDWFWEFCPEVFLEGFVRGSFCPSPFCHNTSVTTES